MFHCYTLHVKRESWPGIPAFGVRPWLPRSTDSTETMIPSCRLRLAWFLASFIGCARILVQADLWRLVID